LAQLKLLKLTGISLEVYILNKDGDILYGGSNYSSIVKNINIGQSAAKQLNQVEGSETKQGAI